MDYGIKEREWEVIFEKLNIIKGIHKNKKVKLRRFKLYGLLREVAVNGDYCQTIMAHGVLFMHDLNVGVTMVFGKSFLTRYKTNQILSTPWLMLPLFEHTRLQQVINQIVKIVSY